MAEFLLELYSEDVPARMQRRAAADLERLFRQRLKTASISHGAIRSWATPLRLGLHMEGLPDATPSLTLEKRGPRVDAPRKVLEGFMRGHGLASLESCARRFEKNGEVYVLTITRPGAAMGEVLASMTAGVIARFPWPKSMRWEAGAFAWARPLRHVLAVFDGKALPGRLKVDGLDLPFSDTSRGHRVEAPASFRVKNFEEYRNALEESSVLLDGDERRLRMVKAAGSAAESLHLRFEPDVRVVEEWTGLCEWPSVAVAKLEEEVLRLPEAVVAVVLGGQKCLPLRTRDGRLAAHCVVVADRRVFGDAILRGYRRVLTARFEDVAFHLKKDIDTGLAALGRALAGVSFHEKLGDMARRARRLGELSAFLAGYVWGADETVRKLARQAGSLAKADVASSLVSEFPALQGVVAAHLARLQGLEESVVAAIAGQNRLKGASDGDAAPQSPVVAAVALADRLDKLTGFWRVRLTPRGSSDPYALRRAAVEVVALCADGGTPYFSLRACVDKAQALYAEDGIHGDRQETGKGKEKEGGRSIFEELWPFVLERLAARLQEEGVPGEVVAASLRARRESWRMEESLLYAPRFLMEAARALHVRLAEPPMAALVAAYKRADNILRKSEAADDDDAESKAPVEDMKDMEDMEEAEESLLRALRAAHAALDDSLKAGRFHEALQALLVAGRPLGRFFDEVTVQCDDEEKRRRRLALLFRLRSMFRRIADFSLLQGQVAGHKARKLSS